MMDLITLLIGWYAIPLAIVWLFRLLFLELPARIHYWRKDRNESRDI